MSLWRCLIAAGLAALAPAVSGCAVVTAPTTLIERAVEARSAADIAKDNRIVLRINGMMANLGTIKASTEIYEQRLLVTGLFDDRALYERFRMRVKSVTGVKQLYWHVHYMSAKERQRRGEKLLSWPDAMILDNEVGVRLIGTRGVADVNFRVASDALATIYLLGRARSAEEKRKALAIARATEDVRKVVDYVVVRP